MHRILTGLFLIVTLLVGLCSAEPGKGKLSPGDKVEVEWAGKRVVAEVVEYLANGWIKVKFKSGTVDGSAAAAAGIHAPVRSPAV